MSHHPYAGITHLKCSAGDVEPGHDALHLRHEFGTATGVGFHRPARGHIVRGAIFVEGGANGTLYRRRVRRVWPQLRTTTRTVLD
jgi:hypothetical protein